MSDIESGKILVADHQGAYVIKMSGDVRLTLCVAFDKCIEALFSRNDFQLVLFDLNEAQNLDSTTLGFIAKVAIKCQKKKMSKPIIFCHQFSVKKLLETMGINEICNIIDQTPGEFGDSVNYQSLPSTEDQDEEIVKNKVIEAHQILMSLNENNRKSFTDLVETLKFA